ncbi:MAG: aminoacyl-histidine dipeptidase [Rikenellaceae bacterium]|nr:aminoacyl-histidine dipeptidase [Rikenellaceae bacterium]
MEKVKNLEPNAVWRYFDEITSVPRPSKHEEKIIEYLKKFAAENHLEYKTDGTGNIVIIRPPSAGWEDKPGVILQSHVDMVCEKNENVNFDFFTQGIKAYVDGDWVRAEGTTLGADCGIGMAAAMASLVSDIKCGRIEALFTVDEETGLSGAFGLGTGMITGKYLINLDSEDEGEVFIGCAGGIDTIAELRYKTEPVPENYKGYRVSITGLSGGHSGNDINRGLGNSVKIVNRFLWNAAEKFGARVSVFNGGSLRNAIPREAYADFVVDHVDLQSYFEQFRCEILSEYENIEINIVLELSDTEVKTVMDGESQKKLLNSLYAVANGVLKMSPYINGLVDTSTNLASVKFTDGGLIEIVTSQRSASESSKYDAMAQVESAFRLADGNVIHSDGYPGWTPNPSSELLNILKRTYCDMFGTEPEVKAVHAGLECGLFLKKFPHLDMVSIGPTMTGVHSPDEKLNIPSVAKFWEFLKAILENI